MARVVDDGDNLHVLPVVTRGATENLNSLLYLRGIDAAIINSDALEEYKSQVPDIQRRIAYVLNLFPSELHIFVRPEIQSLSDLAGKKVNFNSQGTAAAYSGPLIFSRLGIEIEKTFIPHQVALEQMRKGLHRGDGLSTPEVSFKACGNTQEKMRKAENKATPIIKQAEVVKSSVVRVMELQEKGWTYVKP